MENVKKKRFSGTFSVLQRVGRAFMLPIALLPIAGLLLGIGASLTNITTLEAYNLIGIMGPGTFLYSVFTLFSSVGTVIFDNLPIIFAMGVALGMAENEKGTATLSVTFEISGTDELNKIIEKIRQIDSVIDIERSAT